MSETAVWSQLRDGVEVAVALSEPQLLLGVRDGFVRYFHRGLAEPVPVAVVPHAPEGVGRSGLALNDEEAVARARTRASCLADSLKDTYHFFVAVESGLDCVRVEGQERYFVRSWAVVLGLGSEAWGANGSLEIPAKSMEGLRPGMVPGLRRRGGLISSLTGRVENRRGAVADSTFHAVCSLFYGLLDGHPLRTI